MADDSQEVADIIDGLGDSPAPLEVYNATRDYDTRYLASAGAAAAAAGGGGGGGSQPLTAAYDTYPLVAIAHTVTADIPLIQESGDSLLDLTDPSVPFFTQSGVCVLSVQVYAAAACAFEFNLHGVGDGLGANVPKIASGNQVANVTVTSPITANDSLRIGVTNHDSSVDTVFGVQWLSIVFFPAATP